MATKSERISRRRFTVATLSAGASLLCSPRLSAASTEVRPTGSNVANIPITGSSANTSFASLRHIDAGLLNVGYAEAGSPSGFPVILLHGWPYDIYSFVDVAPLLAAKGYRVIVPYLRGFGTTSFLSRETFRNGQQSVVALDTIALMDALKIDKAILAGFDWGARTADIIGALWPERCKALVSVSGYLIGSPAAGRTPLPPQTELQWWYQFYFATERGEAGYGKYRRDFAKLIWKLASPNWNFDDATFDRSAASLDNLDQVKIVIHNYRWRQVWPMVSRSTTTSRSDSSRALSLLCPPSLLKVTRTARHIPMPAHTPANSPASMSIESYRGASGTTCLKRPPVLSSELCWTSIAIEL